MSKYRFLLNLQLFAEDDDIILPDDFQEAPPQAEETPVETQEQPTDTLEAETDGEDTKPPQEVQEPVTEPQKVKIKYNHEEREVSLEEAAALAQKGLNYEKAVERAKQEARDAVIAEQGYTWNGKPITTEAEYKQAQMEQEIMERYQGQVPDEIMQEIIESRRDREERKREKDAAAAQAKKDADFTAFFDYFKDANGRAFDPKTDTIPASVQEAMQRGESLKHAYMEHHNKELINRLKIAEQNNANKQKAPIGSVTAGGGTKTEPVDPLMAGFDEYN